MQLERKTIKAIAESVNAVADNSELIAQDIYEALEVKHGAEDIEKFFARLVCDRPTVPWSDEVRQWAQDYPIDDREREEFCWDNGQPVTIRVEAPPDVLQDLVVYVMEQTAMKPGVAAETEETVPVVEQEATPVSEPAPPPQSEPTKTQPNPVQCGDLVRFYRSAQRLLDMGIDFDRFSSLHASLEEFTAEQRQLLVDLANAWDGYGS